MSYLFLCYFILLLHYYLNLFKAVLINIWKPVIWFQVTINQLASLKVMENRRKWFKLGKKLLIVPSIRSTCEWLYNLTSNSVETHPRCRFNFVLLILFRFVSYLLKFGLKLKIRKADKLCKFTISNMKLNRQGSSPSFSSNIKRTKAS